MNEVSIKIIINPIKLKLLVRGIRCIVLIFRSIKLEEYIHPNAYIHPYIQVRERFRESTPISCQLSTSFSDISSEGEGIVFGLKMPREINEIKDFLLKARRKDAKSVQIKKNSDTTKFKVINVGSFIEAGALIIYTIHCRSDVLASCTRWSSPTKRRPKNSSNPCPRVYKSRS